MQKQAKTSVKNIKNYFVIILYDISVKKSR